MSSISVQTKEAQRSHPVIHMIDGAGRWAQTASRLEVRHFQQEKPKSLVTLECGMNVLYLQHVINNMIYFEQLSAAAGVSSMRSTQKKNMYLHIQFILLISLLWFGHCQLFTVNKGCSHSQECFNRSVTLLAENKRTSFLLLLTELQVLMKCC